MYIKEDLHSCCMSPAIYEELGKFRGRYKINTHKFSNNIFMSTGEILITHKIPSTQLERN